MKTVRAIRLEKMQLGDAKDIFDAKQTIVNAFGEVNVTLNSSLGALISNVPVTHLMAMFGYDYRIDNDTDEYKITLIVNVPSFSAEIFDVSVSENIFNLFLIYGVKSTNDNLYKIFSEHTLSAVGIYEKVAVSTVNGSLKQVIMNVDGVTVVNDNSFFINTHSTALLYAGKPAKIDLQLSANASESDVTISYFKKR